MAAARICRASSAAGCEDLQLAATDTQLVQPSPAAGPLAARWPLMLTTTHMVPEPTKSLLNEAFFLWVVEDRFTTAARSSASSVFRKLMEALRTLVVSKHPTLSDFLDVEATNFTSICEAVGQYMQSVSFPAEFFTPVSGVFPVLRYIDWADRLNSPDSSTQNLAFVSKIDGLLQHFQNCRHVLTDPISSISTTSMVSTLA
jgi:hypothetical protein